MCVCAIDYLGNGFLKHKGGDSSIPFHVIEQPKGPFLFSPRSF